MRTLRRALLGAVAITLAVSGGVFATSLSANAADPVTALTYEASQLTSGPEALRSSAAYGPADEVSVVQSAGESLTFSGQSAASPGHSLTIQVAPSASAPHWNVGGYYTVTAPAQPWNIAFTLTKDGVTCTVVSALLNVEEAGRDATGALTSFAASYRVTGCGGTNEDLRGELRYNSSLGYVATEYSTSRLDFGTIGLGDGYTADQSVTYTARGSVPTQFATPVLSPYSAFHVTADSCANTTLAPGQSCTVTIRAMANALGTINDQYESVIPGQGTQTINLVLNGIDTHTASLTPSAFSFSAPVGSRSAAQTTTVTVTGPNAITFSAAYVNSYYDAVFAVTADTCAGRTIATNGTCSVSVTAQPSSIGSVSGQLVLPSTVTGGTMSVALTANGQDTGAGTYAPVPPARLLDTRSGLGAPKTAVGPKGVVTLQVAGRGGVPAGASAVVLNVTVTGSTATGFVSVYPSGGVRPTVSSLNFPKGWTGANSVTVSLSDKGKVDLYNNSGAVQLIADVVGYYLGGTAAATGAGEYQPVEPLRLLDSRAPGAGGRLPAGGAYQVPADFGADNAHVRAWAVNVTAVGPTKAGFFTTWSGAGTRPTASTLNYAPGQTVSNFAIVPSAPCAVCTGSAHGLPSIGVYSSASAYVLVDIFGYYDDGVAGDGLRFRPMTPVRIADTRPGTGFTTPRPWGNVTVDVIPPISVMQAAPGAAAYAMNVTAIAPTRNTYLTVWPPGGDVSRPAVSNVNANAGAVVSNAAITVIGPYDFYLYNLAGDTNFCVDVSGAFYAPARIQSASLKAGVDATAPDPVKPKTLSATQPNSVLH